LSEDKSRAGERPPSPAPLREKVALVTGATGVLGREVVKKLVENGAIVAAAYRDAKKRDELLAYAPAPAGTLSTFRTDLTDAAGITSMVDSILAEHGRIDFLLNLAGAYMGGREIRDMPESEWDAMMAVNLKSIFLCAKAVLPSMIARNYGKIVTIAARQAAERKARAKSGAYVVSKAGVIVLTETIAEEVRKSDITINCIVPGTIDTPSNRASMPAADASKWVRAEDIAEVILFLVSDRSRITSGATIPVYGKS
jgi:NAD(P)-dependent dehydrogenase (short-subunit alcohol dehydrogenase family)